ncbi:MAG: NmrA/HSCARG family protein [Nitrospina sp.]|nr:MAG: NmrA/HSCARG family protein [Nitrospina sp.]TDJ61537.1 MAG: NmrA/HSCARG family protein [Nitrospina sp.]
MSKQLSVLVIGATGNQGGAVVRNLLPKGHRIRTLTRNPDSPKAKQLAEQGVEVLKGDFTDSDSLVKAATGMDTVFAMTTPFEAGVEAEAKQGIALADAVKQAGVGHLVFNSVASADRNTGIPHFDSKHKVEQHMASLKIPYTIVAPVFFMDNWFTPWFLPSIQEGTLKFAMPPDRPLQQVSVDNIGAFAAAMIERRDGVFGKRFDITGDELTGKETVAVISKASGRDIGYEGFDPEFMRADNPDFAEMFSWFNKVGYSVDSKNLHKEFPEVQWQNFKDWAQQQDWSALK